jgi:hypothetical protein
MDYCLLTDVLGLIGDDTNPTPRPSPAPYSDTVIAACITQASRAIDRDITNSEQGDDYLKAETLTAQTQKGRVDGNGNIIAWLHKPIVTAVTAFAYRYTPLESWVTVNVSYVAIDCYKVTAYTALPVRGDVYIRATYAGGLGAATANLPGDITRAASVLAARYYKEGKTGLTDVIGITEFGQAQYVKAIPAEVKAILSPYERPVPW